MLERIEAMLNQMANKNNAVKSEEWLDNGDMCALLGITKRTLQRYRQKGVIPYYMMKGKPYYRPDDVRQCLKRIIRGNSNHP
jgi:hypothetical protein